MSSLIKLIPSYLKQQVPTLTQHVSDFSQKCWTLIPPHHQGNVKAGIAGSVLGGMIAPVLPSFIPSAVSIIGGAYLGVQAHKTLQQQGENSPYQPAINWVNETSKNCWNKMSKNVQAGLAGAALGSVIGPFILPRFVPSAVSIAGGAYLAMQAYKKMGEE